MKLKTLACGLGLAVMSLTACSSGKTVLPYFTDLPAEGAVPTSDFTIKIMPDDELLINVSASDPASVEAYTVPFQHPRVRDFNTIYGQVLESSTISRRASALQLQTFQVGVDGFINFPVLGRIHVEGMTLDGLADYLEEKISEKVVDPMVTVELVNFRINVTGEVNKPGPQSVNRERYSILDAIAMAGDLNQFGERKNVLLIREENGQRTFHRIDLNSKETLTSPYFYLKQNDVIYVEPNTVRQANARTDQERQFRLSMTSVIVSATSVIASLVIALLVK